LLFIGLYNVLAVEVNLIDWQTVNSTVVNSSDNDIRAFLKIVNDLLWKLAIVLVFILFIYLGIILMKSEWNEEDMKKVKIVS